MSIFSSFNHELPQATVIKNLLRQDSGDLLHLNPQLDVVDGRRAAVLIGLFYNKKNQLHVLLTHRSENLRTSPGEVSFPGGKRDPTDKDDVETALREAEEEIGLPAGEVQVISRLPPMFSLGSLIVTPVVAFLPDDCLGKVVINEEEVQEVFSVPVAMFLSRKHHHSTFTNWQGRLQYIHFFQRGRRGEAVPLIFGLTAYLCICVASVIYKRDPDFTMETTFDRKDLVKGYAIAYSLIFLASHMDVYRRRRAAMAHVLDPLKSKL